MTNKYNLYLMNNHKRQRLNKQQRHTKNLRKMLLMINRKRFFLLANQLIKQLIKQLPINGQNNQLLIKIREELKRKCSKMKYKNQEAEIYFCLALSSHLINHTEAEKDYEIALSYEGTHQQIHLTFALFLYGKKRYAKGVKQLDKLQIKTAFEQKHRINFWYILMAKEKTSIYLQLEKPKGISIKGQELSKLQFINKIIQFEEFFYYRCTQIESLSQNSFLLLAWLLYRQDKFEDSLTLTQKLQNINNPKTQLIQSNLTSLFYLLHQFDEAIECAQQILKINPNNQKIYELLGVILLQQKRYPQAKDIIIKLTKLNKFNYMAYQLLGAIFKNQGQRQLADQLFRIATIIQPSEVTFGILAANLFEQRKHIESQKWFLKSIIVKPENSNYPLLGQLYLSVGAYLSAIRCFIQAMRLRWLELKSFYYLGLCAKSNNFLKNLINSFMNIIKKANPNQLILSINLAVYKFISKQSQNQFYDFVDNFLEQFKKEGEQTAYSDIATNLLHEYFQLINPNYKYLDSIFAMLMGYLGRIKKQYSKTHQIYVNLINKNKINQNGSFYAFTQMYQLQIKQTPKKLQILMLQFMIAQMVQQNTDQAIQCYFKSLSYAEGNYEQFHAQLYKKVQKDISYIPKIDLLFQNAIDSQYQEEDYIHFQQIRRQKIYRTLQKSLSLIQIVRQQIKNIKKLQQKGQPLILNEGLANFIKDGKLFLFKVGLNQEKIQMKDEYRYINDQILSEEQKIKVDIDHISRIYNKNSEIKSLLQKIIFIIQPYFNELVLNQKIEVIFNHFYPFILSKSCHKQFAEALFKLKRIPEHNFEYLKEDLQKIFKEGNKNKKEVKQWVFKQQSEVGSVSSFFQSVINYPLINLISQTKSQFDGIDFSQDQSFKFGEAKEGSKVNSENSEPHFSNSDEEENQDQQIQKRENKSQVLIKKMNENQQNNQLKQPKKDFKSSFVSQKSNTLSQNAEKDSSSEQSESEFEISNYSDDESISVQQERWFSLPQFSPNRTKFLNNTLYRKFNQFLHLNTFFLIKYISKQSTAKTQHIAKHLCLQNSIKPNQNFKVKVEYGDQMDSKDFRGGLQQRTLKWIQMMQPIYVFRWIIDIAFGLSQLQELGIYHADLFFRNTIKVTKGNTFMFKIIDFDKAFKVTKTEKIDKCFECTKDLFDFWLRFKFDSAEPRQPCYQLYFSSDQSSEAASCKIYKEQDIIEYIFGDTLQPPLILELKVIKHQSMFYSERLNKCMQLLKDYMRASHLRQYCALVERLLLKVDSQQQEYRRESIQPIQVAKIIEQLNKLKNRKVKLIQFAENVKIIANLYKLNEEQKQVQ